MIEYLRDPKVIYARSFEIIRSEVDYSGFPTDAETVVTRIVHACGMPEVVHDLRISDGFYATARGALRQRKPVLVDAEMVRQGIINKKLETLCMLNDSKAREIGVQYGITRSAAAVELWAPYLEGAVAVIGNAPTALFALLELIDKGLPKPAAIVGLPVGFVGAAESKAELASHPRGIPYLTLLGRKGGSAMAAAVINALAEGLVHG